MFRITTETCHAFTFAEILILAAMNVETIHLASAGRVSPRTTETQRGYLPASHSLLTVRKALQA